jgi:sugar lactone lactonase YvrE
MATDRDGRIWVVESGLDRVVIIDPTTGALEAWGSRGSDPGEFDFHRTGGVPYGDIAFGPSGAFYVVDSANFRIQRFSADRTFSGRWGAFGMGNGQFSDPVSVALDADGNVYVSDDQRNDVQVFDPEGHYLRTIGSTGSGDGQLRDTGEVSIIDGAVYVADYGNDRIAVFALDGTFQRNLASGHLDQPDAVVAGPAGTLVVTAYGGRKVATVGRDGTILDAWSTKDTWVPVGLVAMADGRVAVSEWHTEDTPEDGRVAVYSLTSSR